MAFKITNQKENKLLGRNELVAEMDFEKATPSNNEVKAAVAAAIKADENLVVVRRINVVFGRKKAIITADVYKSRQQLDAVELRKRKQKKEAKPAEGAAKK